MSAATASVVDVSRSEFTTENDERVRNTSALLQPQCTPMPLPALGTQMILQGNGTNVGTVISLRCPAKHKLVGRELVCVMGINSPKWVGETYCKPMSPFGDFGFRVAVLASIISSAIILFMSVAFITSCLLDCISKDEQKKKDREPDVGLWDEETQQQENNRSRCSHKSRNNNNNNNTGKEQSLWDAQKPALCDNRSWRFPQSYPYGPPSPCTYSPAPLIAPLPGYDYDLPLLPQDSQSEQTSGPPQYHGPPRHSCQTKSSGLIHISAIGPGNGLVWQYGAQESSLSEMNPTATDESNIRNMNSAKEWSIRIISI